MSKNGKGKEPGNTALVIAGPLQGFQGKVTGFFQETSEEGVIIPDGLKGLILTINDGNSINNHAFWREEIRLYR